MIRVGISGWTYEPWRGTFYPAGLPVRRQLGYVAERMTSVEVNGSFYALQRPTSYATWASQVPEDFVFAVKGGRFITHLKKLVDVGTPLANFFASGILALGTRTGPVLWQFPASLRYQPERFEAFLALLPQTCADAAVLAGRHDAKVPDDRALTTAPDPSLPLRYAFEVRHESFRDPSFSALLRAYDAALVVSDNPGLWPVFDEVTADFVYVRLHGHEQLYASGYDDASLDRWEGRVRGWADAGADVYVYCDNDAKVRAPYDAMNLLARLDRAASTTTATLGR